MGYPNVESDPGNYVEPEIKGPFHQALQGGHCVFREADSLREAATAEERAAYVLPFERKREQGRRIARAYLAEWEARDRFNAIFPSR